MRLQSFTRSHPYSGCQWRPLCLTILAIAPRTNKGPSTTRLYENMTNCSPTCITRYHHNDIYRECVCKVSQCRIHVQVANGGHIALQFLLLHQEQTRGWAQRDSTKTWPTALLHVKQDNIIIIYIRNAFAKFHKVATIFRIPLEATLPFNYC